MSRPSSTLAHEPLLSSHHETDGPGHGTPVARPRKRSAMAILAIGLLLIGANLRIGVASVGPVLASVREDLGLSATTASLLTTIPVVAFGAFAFLAPALTRRIGMHRLMGLAMITLAAGMMVRLQPSLPSLFAGTVIVGAAIAVANVLMPPSNAIFPTGRD